MMVMHYLALPDQRDHMICVFRQSNHIPSEVFLRKNRDKYIAKARKLVGELQKTRKVDAELLAVIASQNSNGMFLPYIVTALKLADIATNNITNRLIYSKLHGFRPLLLMMGRTQCVTAGQDSRTLCSCTRDHTAVWSLLCALQPQN